VATLVPALLFAVAAWAMLGVPAAAQDASTRPLGPPDATPIAQPPAEPAGDGTGVTLHTELGDIVIGLFTESSPVAAENFLNLASAGFYDGTVFHRVVPGFVIQGGDPEGTGAGGPGYTIPDEPVVGEYGRGIVAMARSSQPNSQGSQFFIVLDDAARSSLDAARTYAIFGRVVEGMDVVDAIAAAPTSGERPVDPVAIESTSIEQVVLPPEPSPPPAADDPELVAKVPQSVSGQALDRRSITGDALQREFGTTDPLISGLADIAQGQGKTLSDLSLVVAHADLPSGQPVDVTGVWIRGADGSSLVVPIASLVIQDDALTATPSTISGRDVQLLASTDQAVPTTGFASGDIVWLIHTADEAARDELITALP
jgi:cyclophilin family peptidyl-prolyl cis-trans isomerase